jgi:1,4-alpha-glucan branching enzyme
MKKPVLSVVLLAHHPFVGAPCSPRSGRKAKAGFLAEEVSFFEAVSRTYLPLLEIFLKMEQNHVPFRLGMVFSPILCSMLQDEKLLLRYLEYLDKKIEFGRKELERNAQDREIHELARHYYDEDVERRIFFTERCEMDILGEFRQLQKRGRIELLTTAASYAFLPFYASSPEVIRSQLETAIISHRRIFGKFPQGFWLPEFGWYEGLELPLVSYGFAYTLMNTHALALGNPPAKKGTFYPVKSSCGFVFLGRDSRAKEDLISLLESGAEYQENFTDAGFELSIKALRPFLGPDGNRCSTGYRYHAAPAAVAAAAGAGGAAGAGRSSPPGSGKKRALYNPGKAREKAAGQARLFLDKRLSLLEEAGQHMEESPISLCVFDADVFGKNWYEGKNFLEGLFRQAASDQRLDVTMPHEYICRQDQTQFQIMVPEFSSWGNDGYAETWLDASNDWMYRHVFRSIQRMIEMTGRFPNDSGIKERALNQAAREILLSQGSDWPKMLFLGKQPEYAREKIEETLRNFTTIFESLGSNYISTEWLTDLERRHSAFPFINYRVFGRRT